jgi:hypothetical protein
MEIKNNATQPHRSMSLPAPTSGKKLIHCDYESRSFSDCRSLNDYESRFLSYENSHGYIFTNLILNLNPMPTEINGLSKRSFKECSGLYFFLIGCKKEAEDFLRDKIMRYFSSLEMKYALTANELRIKHKDERSFFTFWFSSASELAMHKNLHLLKVIGNSEIMENENLSTEESKKFESKIRAFHGFIEDDALEFESSDEQEKQKAIGEDEDMIFSFEGMQNHQ